MKPTPASTRKPGSMGLSQIHNYSNTSNNPTMKSRTQYATPYTLSPPPQPNTRQQLNTMDSRRSNNNMNQNNNQTFDLMPQNNNNNNNKTSNSTSKSSEQKKEFVSMDELLGYLNYINNQPGDAFKSDTIPFEQINLQATNKNKSSTKRHGASYNRNQPDFGKKSPTQTFANNSQRNPSLNVQNSLKTLNNDNIQQQGSDDGSSITDTKKKLNKNRAIKRIIQTAFDLLEKNYHFTDNQQQLSSLDTQRSTSTQFNIYLKQYNRIIQQINSKQLQQQFKYNRLQDQNEDQLQQVFEYTVMDDFREKLSVAFTKQRVSKNNVGMMISAFRDALVMLKLNEMKIEFVDSDNTNSNSNQPVKSFKMSEIQNVQYYTHPYIFIVLTINKDKNKSKQHLYLKFSSEQNQNKWDRALYCCYMSRKMSKKEKLFEIEFPVEDVMKKQKEEFRKQDEEYLFSSNNNNGENNSNNQRDNNLYVVEKCFRQLPDTHSINSNYPSYDIDGQRNLISDRSQYMNLPKNRNMTEQKITISIHNPDSVDDNGRRMNTVQNKGSKYDNPFKGVEVNTISKPKQGNNNNSNNNNQMMRDSVMSFGTGKMKRTQSQQQNGAYDYDDDGFYNGGDHNNNNNDDNMMMQTSLNNTNNNSPSPKKQQSVFLPNNQQDQQSMGYSKKSTFNKDQQQQSPPNNRKGTMSPNNSQSPFTNKSTNPFMRLLKVAETQSQKQLQQQQKQQQHLTKQQQQQQQQNTDNIHRKDTLLHQRMLKLKRIREIEKNNVRGIVCQKQKFFMNKQKIIFFHDQNLISSARKKQGAQMYTLQVVRNISSKEYQQNKYLQYWDYDYKKDTKQEKKLIPLVNIVQFDLIPSQLGQTTSTLVMGYNINVGNKQQRKQLKLIFANPFSSPTSTTTNNNIPNNNNNNNTTISGQMSLNKGEQVCEWIRLIKQV